MNQLIQQLEALLPEVSFSQGDSFSWSPQKKSIHYPTARLKTTAGQWALLHEAGHAALGHINYQSDLELLLMEVAAWEKAVEIGQTLGTKIEPDHIQDCLDTYRDWLHHRSKCPGCGNVSLQIDLYTYSCHNCNTKWQVTASRFCRAYRRRMFSAKEKRLSEKSPEATFI